MARREFRAITQILRAGNILPAPRDNHTAPDVTPRKCDDLELARRLQAAGMAGCAIKSHYMDTSGRAALLQKLYPEVSM